MEGGWRASVSAVDRRLAWLVLLVASAAVPLACGDVVVDGAGVGASGQSSSVSTTGAGGAGGAGGASCSLTTTGAGAGVSQLTECPEVPAGGCPNLYDANQIIEPMNCAYLVSVDCGPVPEGDRCCYVVHEEPHTCKQ